MGIGRGRMSETNDIDASKRFADISVPFDMELGLVLLGIMDE
jgi:hypothetical protein